MGNVICITQPAPAEQLSNEEHCHYQHNQKVYQQLNKTFKIRTKLSTPLALFLYEMMLLILLNCHSIWTTKTVEMWFQRRHQRKNTTLIQFIIRTVLKCLVIHHYTRICIKLRFDCKGINTRQSRGVKEEMRKENKDETCSGP